MGMEDAFKQAYAEMQADMQAATRVYEELMVKIHNHYTERIARIIQGEPTPGAFGEEIEAFSHLMDGDGR